MRLHLCHNQRRWKLHHDVTSRKDRNGRLVRRALDMGVFLKSIETSLGNGVSIEVVEEVDRDDQGKKPKINLAHELSFCFFGEFGGVGAVGIQEGELFGGDILDFFTSGFEDGNVTYFRFSAVHLISDSVHERRNRFELIFFGDAYDN